MFFLVCLLLIGGGVYFVLQQRKCASAPAEKKRGKKIISREVVKEEPKSEQVLKVETVKERTEDSVKTTSKKGIVKEMNKESKKEVSLEKEKEKDTVSKKETSTKGETTSTKSSSLKEIVSKTPVWKPYSQMTMEEKQKAGLLQEKTYGKYLTDEQLVAPKDSLEVIAKAETNPMPLRPLRALPGGGNIALAPPAVPPAETPKKRRRRKKKSASARSRKVSSILSKSASLISDFTQHSSSSPTRLLMEAEEVPEQPPYSPTFYVAPTKLTSSWPEVGEVAVEGPPPAPPVLNYRPNGMKKVRVLSKERIRKKKSLSASEISM